MTTLFLDNDGCFAKDDGNSIAVYEGTEKISNIPMGPLSSVVLKGDCSVSASLLGKLGQRGISILVQAGHRYEPVLMFPAGQKSLERKLLQFEKASDPIECLNLAKHIVERKIHSEIQLLSFLLEGKRNHHLLISSIKKLTEGKNRIPLAKDIEELLGIEGSAAAQYFSGLSSSFSPSLGFTRRNRRPPTDPVNACLSLGYTLIYGLAAFLCHSHGFEPLLGFYHKPLSGRFSLACDLIEPVRTELDKISINLFKDSLLKPEDFMMHGNACRLKKHGKAVFYQTFSSAKENLLKRLQEELDLIILKMKGETKENFHDNMVGH